MLFLNRASLSKNNSDMNTKIILLICFLLTVTSSKFTVYSQGRDKEAELIIENQLHDRDSTQVNTFREATRALDNGDYILADSLYTKVYSKVPDFDPMLRRLGSIRNERGKTLEGIMICQKAVDINRSAYNLMALATCYLSPGRSQDLNKALQLLEEAQKLPNGDAMETTVLMGQVYLQQNNIPAFRNICSILQKQYPDKLATHYFNALIAANDNKWKLAEKEIYAAKNLGLSDDAVQAFLDSGVRSHLTWQKYLFYAILVTSIWALGLLLLYIIGKILSVITVKSIENGSLEETGKTKDLIRSSYKWLMNICGVYYYLSLPIILALVILLVVGVFYLFLMIGQMPIKLMFILAGGSLFTIYGMIRSLLLKVKYTDPGRELKIEEAPGLYKLTNEVASKLETRPVDEIRITLGTDLAVYERGSWRMKLQDKASRILILGAGIIKEFRQNDFRAVLAHEYGHFSHRDTAGGEVALRVRNDINKYFYALYAAGQNVWWNLAFHFLLLYNFIFRRISFGSTRLQEVLADRVAAKTYGGTAFKDGLTYVIKRNIEFNKITDQEVEAIRNATRPMINIYDQGEISDNELETELNEALNRKTTEDDTHPSPADRFRYIANIDAAEVHPDQSLVRELFADWDFLTGEMAKTAEKNITDSL
jgi:Zn-dependent protease with chaperone function